MDLPATAWVRQSITVARYNPPFLDTQIGAIPDELAPWRGGDVTPAVVGD